MSQPQTTKQPIVDRVELWGGMIFILPLIFLLGGIKAVVDQVEDVRNEGY